MLVSELHKNFQHGFLTEQVIMIHSLNHLLTTMVFQYPVWMIQAHGHAKPTDM